MFVAEPDKVFTVSSRRRNGALIIHVVGELDREGTSLLDEHLLQARDAADTPVLIMDVEALSFCDSLGLGKLITTLQCSQAAGIRMMLSGVQANLKRMLFITGLRNVFEIHPSWQDALRVSTEETPAG